MSTEIIERLKALAAGGGVDRLLCQQAAATLERVERERDEWKEKHRVEWGNHAASLVRAQAAEAQVEALRDEVIGLRRGFAEIMAGCVSGKVGGDDVVWFDMITTLWEFCAGTLDPEGAVDWEVECSDPDAILSALSAPAEERRLPAFVHVTNSGNLNISREDLQAVCDKAAAFDALSAPAEESAPGHTDLMVTPESMAAWFEKDAGARIICDFMNWPEDGPAWDDAHKLYAQLRSASSTPESAGQPDGRPPGDTPWKRFCDEKPTYDGWGERNLLTWNVRSGTYDTACIDGAWRVGEEIDGHADDLWRWLDVNPERHLPAAPAAACVNHPGRPSRTNLDGDELCQECADAWVRGEGEHAAYMEAEARGSQPEGEG